MNRQNVKALIACPDLVYLMQAQSLRNFVEVIGTATTPEELCLQSYDGNIQVIFFVGEGDEDWQDALMESRDNSPNTLLAIYALDRESRPVQKTWSEDSYLDDYLVLPEERERLMQHIQSIANLQSLYGGFKNNDPMAA